MPNAHTMITIDKDVPLPTPKRGAPAKYPFLQMEVGDSFFVDGYSTRMGAIAFWWQKKTGRSFATRKEGDGVRVWRVK